MNIELVLSAVGIPDNTVERWLILNHPARVRANICVVTDSLTEYRNVRTVHVNPQDRFDIGKINNIGIRSSVADIVIKTDVDIVFSANIIEYVRLNVCPGAAVICKCRNIDIDDLDTTEWDGTEIRQAGRGACFAMHVNDWHELKGYDERFRGYGGDDDDLFRRARDLCAVVQSSEYELYHVNHPSRISPAFPNCGKSNMEIHEKLPTWHKLKEAEDWGLNHG